MNEDLFELMDKQIREQGLDDPYENIMNEIKRLWLPFNSYFL